MFDPTKCEAVSMKEAKAQEAQNPVNEISRATSIAFVTLAEGGQIDDVTATETPVSFRPGSIRLHTRPATFAAITANCTAVFRTTLHKQTGPLTPPFPCG